MTGKFFIVDNKKKYKTSFYYPLKKNDKKHDHLTFFFNNKIKLIYNDVRKFGFIKIFNKKNLNNNLHLNNLGPEPLKKNFNHSYFEQYLKGRKRAVKDILMDQQFVSGLGNIYVNEILFLSKIKPTRKVEKLKDYEIKKIIYSTKKILKHSIKSGGSSIKDFSSSNGKKGSFQQYFHVYGKKGDRCSNANCDSKIIKINISNRSTFFCSKCQK